jgi:hypothetical protein
MILVESQCCPPISLFQWIIEHDTILIEQHENYQKRSYRNRFYINGPQGKLLFSIPLCKGKNEQQNIKAVEISYQDSWDIQLSKIVQTNYGSAPYFDFYCDSLLSIFTARPKYLFDLNTQLLKWILKSTQLDKNIEFTRVYDPTPQGEIVDLRNKIRPNKDIVTSKKKVQYAQVHEEMNKFIEDLSILDMIFCCGPETVSIIKSAM